METLILIILPLALTSLGFLTYRHPPVARQILKPLLYLTAGSFLLLQIFNFIQSSAYYNSIDATRLTIYKQKDKDLNIDSLYKVVKDRDSIKLIMLDSRHQREKVYDIYTNQSAIRDSIQKNIYILLQTSRDTNNTYLLYCLAAFFIIIVLHGLSFLFDNIHNKEKVGDINSTAEKTE